MPELLEVFKRLPNSLIVRTTPLITRINHAARSEVMPDIKKSHLLFHGLSTYIAGTPIYSKNFFDCINPGLNCSSLPSQDLASSEVCVSSCDGKKHGPTSLAVTFPYHVRLRCFKSRKCLCQDRCIYMRFHSVDLT